MFRKLSILVILGFLSTQLVGQSVISFTSLQGFPTVMTPQATYNVGAWVKNSGADTLFGAIDVTFHVVGGNDHPIDNNFALPAPLAPGDSTFWYKPGYNFPNGIFAPGNNDVLIWPTKSSGSGGPDSRSDSILVHVFFAPEAAFRLDMNVVPAWNDRGIDFTQNDPVRFVVTNVGSDVNKLPLQIFVRVEDEDEVLIYSTATTVDPTLATSVDFGQLDIYEQIKYILEEVDDRQSVVRVTFFAKEDEGLPPTNYVEFRGIMEQEGPVVTYPAPVVTNSVSDANWEIRYTPLPGEELHTVALISAEGRLVKTFPASASRLEGSGIGAGTYILVLQSKSNTWLTRVVKVD